MTKEDTWKALQEPFIPLEDRGCDNCKHELLLAALIDYDSELEAISRIADDSEVSARDMARQDLPIIRKRHKEALSLNKEQNDE